MISEAEIVSSLAQLDGKFLNISNLHEYAKKITTLGKHFCVRGEVSKELMSYVVYYDNGPEIFITALWTNPNFRRRGLADQLFKKVIQSSDKDVMLELHKDNPSRYLPIKYKFEILEERGDTLRMCLRKRLAIQQPYIFPYIGYFHLIEASTLFVFCDNVNYIKRGWINRNRMLLGNKAFLFTIPVRNASSNRLINETFPFISRKWKDTFYRQLSYAYRRAPYFSDVVDRIISVFESEYIDVADLAINSIISIYDYLGKRIAYTKASLSVPETKGMERSDRPIEICKKLGFKNYVNVFGGRNLYTKDYFQSRGVDLHFLRSSHIEYKQYAEDFVPWLSIIDVLMFNSKDAIADFFAAYTID